MHLQIAERIRQDGGLDSGMLGQIEDQLPAFYLGNVAPDYQTITSTPRVKTHFYNLPPGPEEDACREMLEQYPALRNSDIVSSAQAMFVAAYCCHLLLDLRWYREILIPYFLSPGDWTKEPSNRCLNLPRKPCQKRSQMIGFLLPATRI